MLRESARLLMDGLRKTDIVGRYGGEEFLVICPGSTLESAEFTAHKLRKRFVNHIFPDGNTHCQVTLSVGVAQLRSDMKQHIDLIQKADEALYQAKESGRNRVFLDQSRKGK